MKYSDILKINSSLSYLLNDSEYKIYILSNIVTSQMNEILEFTLRKEQIPAKVKSGDYDNILQDSLRYADCNLIIIFWELCNLIDGFQASAELLDDEQQERFINKTISEIDFVIKNLKSTSLVLMNRFSSLPFSINNLKNSQLENIANQLNLYIMENLPANFKIIDIEKIISTIGIRHCVNYKYFYSSKMLYTFDFFLSYSNYINPIILSNNGKVKKALIFDCDNTLWKGVLGEDGFDKIEMSSDSPEGAVFAEIQSIALALSKNGVLIGICSKNNFSDVDQVIKNHNHMQLKNKDIIVNKSNWDDKASNLKEIAKELNIGLESIVFVDDSPFEVNLIKNILPEITVLQVPEKLYEYPNMLRDNINLFYNASQTKEDLEKVNMYKQQLKRKNAKEYFSDIEDYLASLEIKLKFFTDNKLNIPRLSQMTQKTNQFNLTTNRYSENDIKKFISDDNYRIYAISILDKYGDSGLTGLAIINFDFINSIARIDTLLLSCRVIGRNIEYTFMDLIIESLEKENVDFVFSDYIKTNKNIQVKNFYEKFSFDLIKSTEQVKSYKLKMVKYKKKDLGYIEVLNV